MTKRIISTILAITLLSTGLFTVSVNAAKSDNSADFAVIDNAITETVEDNKVVYKNQDGVEINILTSTNSKKTKNDIPEKYDLRDYNRVTPIRDQGSEGLCWDFASVASIESNIITKSLSEDSPENLDISEGGLAWYTFTQIEDETSILYPDYEEDESKGTLGGNPINVGQTLSNGVGTHPESLLEYSKFSEGYKEAYRYYSDFRLKDFNDYNENANDVKKNIINNGAVTLSFNCFDDNYYEYNGFTSYYDNGTPPGDDDGMSHIVAIVGWDDNFSKNHFNPECSPENDGAWLCKNSWGSDWGNDGYFWISYESAQLMYSQFIMQQANEFDNLYNIQSTANTNIDTKYVANIFKAKSNETLEQISFKNLNPMNYHIYVYSLEDDYVSPEDGKLLADFTGSAECSGIHSVDCPEGIKLKAGKNFSVIVENLSDEAYIAVCSKSETADKLTYFKDLDSQWTDSTNYLEYGYASIKAMTSNENRAADKSKLKEIIEKAKQLDMSSYTSYLIDNLNSCIKNAEAVMNNTSALQYQVDNAYYLLCGITDEIRNYYYYINSMEDFKYFYHQMHDNKKILSQHIILNTDLDFSDFDNFTPLFSKSALSGYFEGNGHTISNLTVTGDENTAFISKVSGGKIQNLNFKNITVNGGHTSSVIAAYCENSSITNCTVTDSIVKSKDYNSGAISGSFSQGEIESCSVTSNLISATSYLGGIYSQGCEVKLTDCTLKDNILKGGNFVGRISPDRKDSFSVNLDMNNYGCTPFIEMTDDSCTISDFVCNISSISAENTSVEKKGDKYYVTETAEEASLYVHFDSEESIYFTYYADFDTKELFIAQYYGSGENIVFPDKIYGFPVTGISDNVFEITDKESIISIEVSDGITEIADKAFSNLSSLESAVIGNNVKKIPQGLFENCYNLVSVKLGQKVTDISDFSFSYCNALSTIHLPDSLENIGNFAFSLCESIKNIKIPDSVKTIGNNAFEMCFSLEKADFGSGVEEIGLQSFYCCRALNSIILPKTVKHIGSSAFMETGATTVQLNSTDIEIDENAFGYFARTSLDGKTAKVPDYVINGYPNCAAEQYAKENGIKFVDISKNSPELGGVFDYNSFICGDVNLDGVVNIIDVTVLQKYLAEIKGFNDVQIINAYVRENTQSISINNATQIQKYVTELIDTLEYSQGVG